MKKTAQLRHLIEIETQIRQSILRCYLFKAGLTTSPQAHRTAKELLNGVVVEVQCHPERLETMRAPIAWKLGLGAKLSHRL